jgi:hypothetical protein
LLRFARNDGAAFLIQGAGQSQVDRRAPPRNDLLRDGGGSRDLSLVVVILNFDTMFNRIAYSTHGRVCREGHPLLLVGA